jgi:hypothetical protein
LDNALNLASSAFVFNVRQRRKVDVELIYDDIVGRPQVSVVSIAETGTCSA